jgi:uncharacterized protein (DUF849 family)
MSLVKACLNGGREPSEHPALPLSPPELAAAARSVMDVGAFAVHVHPRDGEGRQSLEAGPCGAAVEAIRSACPGLPVGLSTAATIEPDAERRLHLVRGGSAKPDFVSVNLFEPGAPELVRALPTLEIGVEAGLETIADASLLVAEELAPACLRVLVEVAEADPAAALTTAAAIDEVLDEAGISLQRVYHGYGDTTWRVIEAALAKGRHVRVGLEDTLTLPDGRLARDNAELVVAALGLAEALGLEGG